MPSDMVPDTAIAITRSRGKLYGFYPEVPIYELLPKSGYQFVNISNAGVIHLTFKEGKSGQVSEVFIETDRDKFSAKKIK